ncbi:MAG: Holliday junction resolvase RuvX [Lachnospiraceae bacterium]|nr:Holliday junction resolvase RuvX [Lachnospiraceae bacterium]
MRLMGLDFGAHTVGVAISDATGTIATAREIIRRERESALRETVRRIESLAREEEIGRIVLGLPLHMDGSMSERAEKTIRFREMLEKRLTVPIEMQDERLTSVEAEEILRMRSIPKKEWKEEIDSLAAEIILQDYINSHG